jgi:predicted glutamine amidotransferase
MCRWMAWHGQPVLIDELLFKTQHGLIDQSLHSRMGAETTNGDGFGLGWYGAGEGPGIYHSVAPAWGDRNLRHLASHIESALFMAHVRATSGTAIQETNCHPFRHGDWLLVHNGVIAEFHTLRRDLMLAVDPALFANIQGSTDSEVLFHLALTFGLEDDPLAALERAVGLVEATAERHGIEHAMQGSIGVSDGRNLWAVRYSTEGRSRTLFTSTDVHAVQQLHPDNPRLQRLREGDRVIVSEPISDLPGLWQEIPEATALIVAPGGAHEQRPFTPSREDHPVRGMRSAPSLPTVG